MRISRKDAGEGPKDQPPADDAGGRPPSASDSAPAFDWSKVSGGGKSDIKKRKKEKKEAVPSDNVGPKISRWVPNLTRNEQYIAGAVVVLLIGIIYFAFLRGDPGLRNVLSASEAKQFEQKAQAEMVDSYETLFKNFGPDHPEVKQQREMLRQLGITPKH